MTKTKEHRRYYSPSGSRYANEHIIEIDDEGHKTLVKSGKTIDTYAKIQAHKDSVDIDKLLERAEIEGYEVLNQRQANYMDLTIMPKNLIESAQMLQAAENDFNKLPLETRKEFNFSFTEYIAAANKDITKFAEKLGIKREVTPTEILGGETTSPVEEKGAEVNE